MGRQQGYSSYAVHHMDRKIPKPMNQRLEYLQCLANSGYLR